MNLIGQRLLQPNIVNVAGAGFSLYADAGGDAPGSEWGRISLDALILAQHREADRANAVTSSTGWEARISLSGSGKVMMGGVGHVSVGPRILSSGDVGIFSTFAFSYDADRLITTLLSPPAAP